MGAFALIVVGLATLVLGAELVVRGGSRLAERLGVSPLIVGLTLVSVGTSAPELAIGIDAARSGVGALAVGNVAGTNTLNLLFILGFTALLRPLPLGTQSWRIDLPATALAALILLLMTVDGTLSYLDGALLLVIAVAYTLTVLRISRSERRRGRDSPLPPASALPVAFEAGALVLGIAAVVLGADWLVRGAVDLARQLDVSDALVGLTVVAVGTSAPELATTLVNTFRGHRDIAVGNLVGSSFYNISLILGGTALSDPRTLHLPSFLVRVDLPVMTCAVLACVLIFFRRRQVTRMEGGLLVLAYVAYFIYLVPART